MILFGGVYYNVVTLRVTRIVGVLDASLDSAVQELQGLTVPGEVVVVFNDTPAGDASSFIIQNLGLKQPLAVG